MLPHIAKSLVYLTSTTRSQRIQKFPGIHTHSDSFSQLIEERSLTLARRMHVAEKAWSKLAKHFALRVTEADSGELQQAAEFVARYRALAEELWAAVVAREADPVGIASVASKVRHAALS